MIRTHETIRRTAALLALCSLLLSTLLTGCGNKQTLTLYTWEGMFPQEILDAFTKDTGISVNYVNFDTDETMLAKLDAADGGDYDIIIADDYIIEQAALKGLIKELDKDKLSNYSNINPIYMGQYYDPEDRFTVPYGAGIMELVYAPDRVSVDITGYGDLWDPSLKGRVGIIANPRVVNGMALKLDGHSFNTTDETLIRSAGDRLIELAPNIRLIKDSYLNDDLVTGEIDAGLMYTSQATIACLSDSSLRAVLPKEGLGYGIMAMFIPSKAPNSEASYRFMDYILDARNAAACFDFMGYYCTNLAAEEYLSPEIKPYITLPAESIKDYDMEMIENIPGEVYDIHEEIWTRFRTYCE